MALSDPIANDPLSSDMLSTFDLSKRYGDTLALSLRDLQVLAGERVGLVGNNGAGKTTLLRLALDLIRPTTGRVELAGVRVGARDESWKHRVGAFLDARFLVDYLRPQEYLRFVAGAYGVNADEAGMPEEHFLDELLIEGFGRNAVHHTGNRDTHRHG